jgi:hypothetical protein
LLKLALNCDLPNLSLVNIWNYSHEPSSRLKVTTLNVLKGKQMKLLESRGNFTGTQAAKTAPITVFES